MLPRVVICGRPNVGKSTLLNQLVGNKVSMVHNRPGVTRDWVSVVLKDEQIELVDTAGLHEVTDGTLETLATKQALKMMRKASLILLVVDGRDGLAHQDSYCANVMRHCPQVPTAVVVNKCEALNAEVAAAEFHSLGFENIFAVAAAHRQGLGQLRKFISDQLSSQVLGHAHEQAQAAEPESEDTTSVKKPKPIRIAIIGRPNVGKSTLANKLLKDERMLVSPIAGTTVDNVKNKIQFGDVQIELIDTAGIRRKGRIDEPVELESTIAARRAASGADVVLFLIDASDGVVHQDQLLASLIVDYGRATVVLLNKADLIEESDKRRLKGKARRDLQFMNHAAMLLVSVSSSEFKPDKLLQEALDCLSKATKRITPHKISKILREAVRSTQPPRSHGKRPALRYAHQVGVNPPVFVIHGRHVELIKSPYTRYLAGQFSQSLDLGGAPLQIRFKESSAKPKIVQ